MRSHSSSTLDNNSFFAFVTGSVGVELVMHEHKHEHE